MQICRGLASQALGNFVLLCQGSIYRRSSSAAAQSSGILAKYLRLVNSGKLHADNTQLAAVQALQLLQDSMAIRMKQQLTAAAGEDQPGLVHQEAAAGAGARVGQQRGKTQPDSSQISSNSRNIKDAGQGARTAAAGGGSVGALAETSTADETPASSSSSSSVPVVQGAYLWGPVGSGKTLIMDMFLSSLPCVTLPTALANPGTTHSRHDGHNTSGSSGSSSGGSVIHAESEACDSQQQVQLRSHRIHYHELMLAVHDQLHQLQQALPKVVTYSRSGLPVYRYALPPEDPVQLVARNAAAGLDLLCLDELHITDVADAMLLARLFEGILDCGCTVLFTSNRPARDLYKGGLSRKYFEPFIWLIDERLLQLKVAGGRDYRLLQQNSHHQQRQQQQQQQQGGVVSTAAEGIKVKGDRGGLWFVGVDGEQQLQQQWQQLAQQLEQQTPAAHGGFAAANAAAAARHDVIDCSTRIPLPFGRTLWVPRALLQTSTASSSSDSSRSSSNDQVPEHPPGLVAAHFTFSQLCSNQGSRQSLEHAGALSSNDYLALVRSCPVIFIQGLPQLTPQLRDEARRLVTLVDLVYEVHTLKPGSVRLIVSSEVTPEELFLPLLGAAAAQGVNPNLGRSGGKLDVKQLVQDHRAQSTTATSSVATGDALGTAAGEVGGGDWQQSQQHSRSTAAGVSGGTAAAPVSPLLPEEVLMYHRASSRLVELCRVVSST